MCLRPEPIGGIPAETARVASAAFPKTLPETKSLTRRGFVANAVPSRAVVRRSEWEDDEHGMDARGPTPLCTGHPGDRQAGHAGSPGGDDRHHPSPFVRRSAAGLADLGHPPGLVARGARRPRLAPAAARLAAPPDGV